MAPLCDETPWATFALRGAATVARFVKCLDAPIGGVIATTARLKKVAKSAVPPASCDVEALASKKRRRPTKDALPEETFDSMVDGADGERAAVAFDDFINVVFKPLGGLRIDEINFKECTSNYLRLIRFVIDGKITIDDVAMDSYKKVRSLTHSTSMSIHSAALVRSNGVASEPLVSDDKVHTAERFTLSAGSLSQASSSQLPPRTPIQSLPQWATEEYSRSRLHELMQEPGWLYNLMACISTPSYGRAVRHQPFFFPLLQQFVTFCGTVEATSELGDLLNAASDSMMKCVPASWGLFCTLVRRLAPSVHEQLSEVSSGVFDSHERLAQMETLRMASLLEAMQTVSAGATRLTKDDFNDTLEWLKHDDQKPLLVFFAQVDSSLRHSAWPRFWTSVLSKLRVELREQWSDDRKKTDWKRVLVTSLPDSSRLTKRKTHNNTNQQRNIVFFLIKTFKMLFYFF